MLGAKENTRVTAGSGTLPLFFICSTRRIKYRNRSPSRNARKTGARNFLSRVHSANLISQTKTGFTQCIFRIIEGVMS